MAITLDGTNGVTTPSLTADTTTLVVDESNNRVGIGTSSPKTELSVDGSAISGFNASAFGWQHYQQASSTYTATEINSELSGASSFLSFKTNGNWTNGNAVERMRIDSSGNLLVGATSSRGQFTLGDYADFEATGKNLRAMCESGSAIQFSTKGTATTNLTFIQFGRSATSPGSYTSEGNIQTDGSGNLAFVNASDARLKTNIRDLDNALSIAMSLKPRIFDWLDEEKPKNVKGFIAQELEEILPRTVSESEDGIKQVGITNELLPILVKSIQELKTELDTVKAELETLETTAADLQTRVTALETAE